MNRFVCLILTCTILAGGMQACAFGQAYLLEESSRESNLVVLDTNSHEIIRTIKIPRDKAFNNFTVDNMGNCYISNYRSAENYFHDVYFYDYGRNRIEKYVDLENAYGPRNILLSGKCLAIEVRGNNDSRTYSGIIFVDNDTKEIRKKIYLHEKDPNYCQININCLYYDGSEEALFSTYQALNPGPFEEFVKQENTGDIYLLNMKIMEISRTIYIDRKYKHIQGVCKIGNKVYVAAGFDGDPDKEWYLKPNNKLLVYSYDTGELTGSIEVDNVPRDILYDKNSGKIYVHCENYDRVNNDEDTICVVDPIKMKTIKRFSVPFFRMFSIVAPEIIYITEGGVMENYELKHPDLIVLNTKNDKIIKRIPGDYYGISINPKY